MAVTSFPAGPSLIKALASKNGSRLQYWFISIFTCFFWGMIRCCVK